MATKKPKPRPDPTRTEFVRIDTLTPDPNNARKHNAKNLEATKLSLENFGQQKPIVVDATNTVRAGNNTLAAAIALGWTDILIIRSELDETNLTAYALADNRSAELAEWDEPLLESTLDRLKEEGFKTSDLGFTEKTETQKPDDEEMPAAGFAVFVECGTEPAQTKLLQQLADEGLNPKALMSGIAPSTSAAIAPKGKAVAGKLITRETKIDRTPRVLQMEGMFDVPVSTTSKIEWDVALDLPKRWNIGVIVGPSGSGKSTVARELFGDNLIAGWPWPADRSLLDGFPAAMTMQQITGLLSSVGFSSPPAWLRPFAVLSNGQQFRANLARTIAEAQLDGEMKVVDEYTSVVDRTVAQIGSAAVASTIRRNGLQFVAVTCHYDVLDWLEPDWVYEPHTGKLARGRLRRPDECSPGACSRIDDCSAYLRPKIHLEIIRSTSAAWPLFKPHHYLSHGLNKAAACYVALVNNQPAAFTAVLSFPHPTRSGWREHRTVCLPDFQGVGIGNAMSEHIAAIYSATGKPYTSVTSHPAMIRHRWRSPLWKMTRSPQMCFGTDQSGLTKSSGKKVATSFGRSTASFEYIGPTNPAEAQGFGLKTVD